MEQQMFRSEVVRYARGVAVLLVGITLHMAALAVTDRLVPSFPSVPDIVQQHLPFVNLYSLGETVFLALLVCFAIVFFREQPRSLPRLLFYLGMFYALRGVFLFLLPLGAPADAPLLANRFVLYPYPSHAFFPGGHVGILFLMSMSLHHKTVRTLFLAATILFGIGSIITRAHYTADIVGGILLAYGIFLWGRYNAVVQKYFVQPYDRYQALFNRGEETVDK